jgi:hypothetical protein
MKALERARARRSQSWQKNRPRKAAQEYPVVAVSGADRPFLDADYQSAPTSKSRMKWAFLDTMLRPAAPPGVHRRGVAR